jgi:hypothetical protein
MTWAIGSSLVAGIALLASEYGLDSLTTFRLCVGFLTLVSLISLILRYQIDESPAFLVANGFIIRAYECLLAMAKKNKTQEEFEKDNPVAPSIPSDTGEKKDKPCSENRLSQLYSDPLKPTTIKLNIIWFIFGYAYNGMCIFMPVILQHLSDTEWTHE